MKTIILATAFMAAFTSGAFAQKYMTRTGRATFDATTPSSPEKIAGVNNEVASILDSKSGDFVFQVLVKSFKFEKPLMMDHFNENYMESDKFPKSEFKGKITNVGDVNFSKDGSYNVTVSGKLTIHGVAQEVSVPGTLSVKGKDITARAKFAVKLKDYKIEVPNLVSDKVAKESTIIIDAVLNQK